MNEVPALSTFDSSDGYSRIRAQCLQASHRLANRLREAAIWKAGTCTWPITRVDTRDIWSRRALSTLAGADLYQGASGIALFLMETALATRDLDFVPCIEGALRHADALRDELRFTSFFGGKIGLAFALCRYGVEFGNAEFVERAQACLQRCQDEVVRESEVDVVGGLAGAVVPLLLMSRWLNAPLLEVAAVECGNQILRSARIGNVGWSWRSPMPGLERDLTGLAHGASGCGAALLELVAVTGDEGYAKAALLAFSYERQFLDKSRSNWPDFRDGALAEALSTASRRELYSRELLRGEHLPRRQYMLAWCHGAPGICLTRSRALELTGDPQCLSDLTVGVRALTIAPPINNYSLCHGECGNISVLLSIARRTEHLSLADVIAKRMESVLNNLQMGAESFRSGAIDGSADCSLMLGEAGVGYQLLRAGCPKTPDILLLTPERRAILHGPVPTKVNIVRSTVNRAIAESFDTAIRRLKRIGCPIASEDFTECWTLSEAAAVLRSRVSRDSGEAALAKDALQEDLTCQALIHDAENYNDAVLTSLRKRPLKPEEFATAGFRLASCVRILFQEFDWGDNVPNDSPEHLPSPKAFLLRRDGSVVTQKEVNAFAGHVLSAFADGRRCSDVADQMQKEVLSSESTEVYALVLEQLRRAYAAGILEVA